MKVVNISKGEYASKWGIADFCSVSEAKLRGALGSGEDFDTGWFSCMKEIRSGRIIKTAEGISVSVSSHMDDLYEENSLIYDALWEVDRSCWELPDAIIDSILDAAVESELNNATTCEETLPVTATYQEICDTLRKLETTAESELRTMFEALCAIVKANLEYM